MNRTQHWICRLSGRREWRLWPAAVGAVAAAALVLAAAPGRPAAAQQQLAQQQDQPDQTRKRDGGGKAATGGAEAQKKRSGGRRGRRGRRGRPTFVQLDEVKNVPLTQTVPVLGRMVPRQAGMVAARISAPVERVDVQVGDRVKTGDVIAVLVSDALRWQRELRSGEVAQYRGALSSAKAKHTKAKNELRRTKNLRRSSAFSQARFEDQQSEVENLEGEVVKANAELRQAQANLKLAEINLHNARVRAPYAGVVTERHTVAGAYVGVGAPVVTLINDEDLEIEADVPSTRLGGLAAGTVIDVELEDKTRHKAVVRAVVPDENPLARTRAVRLTPSFELNGQTIATNQTVVLNVPVGALREALSVHKDAIIQRGGSSAVYIIEDNRARLRPVRLGEAVGSRFEVYSGVKAGDMAVVRGNERLRPGQRVQVRGGGE